MSSASARTTTCAEKGGGRPPPFTPRAGFCFLHSPSVESKLSFALSFFFSFFFLFLVSYARMYTRHATHSRVHSRLHPPPPSTACRSVVAPGRLFVCVCVRERVCAGRVYIHTHTNGRHGRAYLSAPSVMRSRMYARGRCRRTDARLSASVERGGGVRACRRPLGERGIKGLLDCTLGKMNAPAAVEPIPHCCP